ncbi:hypothetical protein J3A72_000456 [Stenotrophomonas sp. PvP093]|nr:hypothetical protein [Stenotrophomonas sp. PvP093]
MNASSCASSCWHWPACSRRSAPPALPAAGGTAAGHRRQGGRARLPGSPRNLRKNASSCYRSYWHSAGLQPAIGAAGVAGSGLHCSWPPHPGRPHPAAWSTSQSSEECQQLLTQLLSLGRPAAGNRRRRRCRLEPALELAGGRARLPGPPRNLRRNASSCYRSWWHSAGLQPAIGAAGVADSTLSCSRAPPRRPRQAALRPHCLRIVDSSQLCRCYRGLNSRGALRQANSTKSLSVGNR